MHKGIQAARTQRARESIVSLVVSLVGKHGLEPSMVEGLKKTHRDPELRGLFQLEAIVPVLKALDAIVIPTLEERPLNREEIAAAVADIPNMTKTSLEAIQAWVDEEASD